MSSLGININFNEELHVGLTKQHKALSVGLWVRKILRTGILMIQGFEGLSSLCMVRLFYKTIIKYLFEKLRREITSLNPFSCHWTIRLWSTYILIEALTCFSLGHVPISTKPFEN